jgi:hypothetical protein
MAIELTCHAWTPCPAVRRIQVRVRRTAETTLALSFQLDGELARIRLPAPSAPRLTHQLWEHTCCEAFVAAADDHTYHELNLAPSGEWAGYTFRAYREVAGLADESLAPRIATRCLDDRLEVDAVVGLGRLAAGLADAPLRLGLAAVIELVDGSLSYWALHHPAGKPDFHHADARVLRLEPAPGEW